MQGAESEASAGAVPQIDAFRSLVRAEGARLYRDLPWRHTRDPYRIWLSEVMLQQTQVARVEARMDAWLAQFPTVEALAAASVSDVLAAWQGMGYNRRALMLHKTAQIVADAYRGEFPCDTRALKQLPGIGAATAQGIRAFAFNLPGVYLETNVRTVFLHHFFPDVPAVPDRELVPLIEVACPAVPTDGVMRGERGSQGGQGECPLLEAPRARDASCEHSGGDEGSLYAVPQDADDTPRSWYYTLLDYGAYLKKTIPNPSRRSASYTRQSRFEGSRRQKRAEIVRILLVAADGVDGADGSAADVTPEGAETSPPGDSLVTRDRNGVSRGLSLEEVTRQLNAAEHAAGRPAVESSLVEDILNDLEREGFCVRTRCADEGFWSIR